MADIATLCHEREVFNSLCRDGQRHCALSRATPDEGVRGYTISPVLGGEGFLEMTSGTRPLYP